MNLRYDPAMTADPHLVFTLDEYFALERASERRFEYRDGEIVCMSGGSREHGRIASNVHARLAALVRGGDCRVYTADVAVFVPSAPPYRYPNASVVCGEERFREINGLDALENPILLVEVLSPARADFDRGTKFEWYKSIPSFREYLLIAQDRVAVSRRTRRDDGSWVETVFDSPADMVALASLGVELPVAEIYEGL
jgi:Uma2 family endonuclease